MVKSILYVASLVVAASVGVVAGVAKDVGVKQWTRFQSRIYAPSRQPASTSRRRRNASTKFRKNT